jgi:hypothetical protein
MATCGIHFEWWESTKITFVLIECDFTGSSRSARSGHEEYFIQFYLENLFVRKKFWRSTHSLYWRIILKRALQKCGAKFVLKWLHWWNIMSVTKSQSGEWSLLRRYHASTSKQPATFLKHCSPPGMSASLYHSTYSPQHLNIHELSHVAVPWIEQLVVGPDTIPAMNMWDL